MHWQQKVALYMEFFNEAVSTVSEQIAYDSVLGDDREIVYDKLFPKKEVQKVVIQIHMLARPYTFSN